MTEADAETSPLADLPLRDFVEQLSSGSPVPGGGSAAALTGALAAGLLQMVLNLTRAEPGSDAEQRVAELLLAATGWRGEMLRLVDLDATAYDGVVRARRLPRGDERERELRTIHLHKATVEATRVPLQTAEFAVGVATLAEEVADIGNRHAISDVGVAVELAAAAARSAGLNVRINLPYLDAADPLAEDAPKRLAAALDQVEAARRRVAAAVDGRLGPAA